MSEDIRIGVFICHCGHNIGGFVDVPAVTEYAKTLPGVVFATHNLYTCADDGLRCIKDNIKEHNLNRVIVASCTPRTHAPLFQGACQEAGLNKYLFTFVNIREHCSWVHMKEKENATKKAKDLVKMGVARAALLAPQQESRVPVEPSSLVIGGGVAGMTAAVSLADKGFQVTLVEKENELGGMVLILYNLYDGGGDPMAMLKPLVEKVQSHPNIRVMLKSRMTALDGYVGNFRATVQRTDGSQELQLTVGTIIVATGAIDLMPEGLYGYDLYDNVLNLTEFELLCKKKELPKLKSVAFIQCAGSRGQKVSYCSRICCTVALKGAMKIIDNHEELMGRQVVDGKEQVVEKIRVEEKAAEDIADRRRRRRRMDEEREERPAAAAAPADGGVEVTVFNRGITTYGVDHELYYNKAREKRVRFVRFTPERIPVVGREGDKLTVTYWHETLKTERKLQVDMVVLSTPQMAQPDSRELSQMLKVPLGQEGFFLEAHVKLRPVDFATDGIFVCGTAHGPADITESVEQAEAAASRASIPMMRGYVQAEALTSTVNSDLCTGCRTCEFTCPYSAIAVDPKTQKAVVTDVLCKGCGTCAAGCPRGAITMRHYTSQQIEAEIKAFAECREA
ncbi:MAG: CoB--CoM heterodisulfide reductase iron-sulfur subunit A family protein [Euryarchaeota archaeon]|nr:CoB--CoM heterodisulfide reductase iron-sulfur subunit A family protein [Euryarchaeota archaeon]